MQLGHSMNEANPMDFGCSYATPVPDQRWRTPVIVVKACKLGSLLELYRTVYNSIERHTKMPSHLCTWCWEINLLGVHCIGFTWHPIFWDKWAYEELGKAVQCGLQRITVYKEVIVGVLQRNCKLDMASKKSNLSMMRMVQSGRMSLADNDKAVGIAGVLLPGVSVTSKHDSLSFSVMPLLISINREYL